MNRADPKTVSVRISITGAQKDKLQRRISHGGTGTLSSEIGRAIDQYHAGPKQVEQAFLRELKNAKPKDCEQKRVQWQQLAQRGLREIGGTRDWAPRLDWSARDRQVAGAITRTAAQLNAHQGPPQWISRHRLITHSGYARWIAPYLDRLPQTRQAIQTAVETRQAFQLRRAAWYEGREKEVAGKAAESWSRHPPVPSACGQQGLFDASEGGW
ncbi:hypothetical protein NITLEN_20258 [Nitrospira lenta]|uniref:Transposon Tn7 transposition protein TnsD C-terminal domain-containing protein n=2 Tax=Nitrospira lenta TaxID=1436998 RepID=A0A330L473_9BACT|nr:hypothetical protein NITLEN_20258 [Nitrospira lenta]